MTRTRPMVFAALTVAAVLFARPAFAGPPLLCFPFDIGTARTLPMGTGGWRAIDPTYNVAHLVDDTLALLTPETPVLVRMETLRRATIYASVNPAAATALLMTLQTRAAVPDAHAALAVFDFGYLVETYREAKPIFKSLVAAIDHIDGYQLVLKAQAMHRDDTRLRQGYGEAGTMAHAAQLIVDGQPRSTAVK
jgi:hypothetical protein